MTKFARVELEMVTRKGNWGGIMAVRTLTGNSEWAGNFGVRPGIREIGEEEIGRDGLRSWQWEEGDRGCK